MSEYQYYEFQAIDKPLDQKDLQALRNLSSRAQITPTSFVNEYNWGNFKGKPLTLMEKYFDAFLYVANWGTHWLMLKVPLKLVDFDLIKEYCFGENATAYQKGANLIFEFTSDMEDCEWEEGEGRISSLISLRSDIIGGDYRSLYLGWLYCAQVGDFDDDEPEPRVPPNLNDLNAPLQSFVDFMRIDTDLVAVASENSFSEDKQGENQNELKSWINSLPEEEKNETLFRLVTDHDPYLGVELKKQFQQTVSVSANDVIEKKLRTVADLLEKSESNKAEKRRRIDELKAKERARREREMAIAREKYLNDISKREDKVWKKVADLIESRSQSDYDEAVTLLVDLRDLSKKIKKEKIFKAKLRNIHTKHSRKSSFLKRLTNSGLDEE